MNSKQKRDFILSHNLRFVLFYKNKKFISLVNGFFVLFCRRNHDLLYWCRL